MSINRNTYEIDSGSIKNKRTFTTITNEGETDFTEEFCENQDVTNSLELPKKKTKLAHCAYPSSTTGGDGISFMQHNYDEFASHHYSTAGTTLPNSTVIPINLNTGQQQQSIVSTSNMNINPNYSVNIIESDTWQLPPLTPININKTIVQNQTVSNLPSHNSSLLLIPEDRDLVINRLPEGSEKRSRQSFDLSPSFTADEGLSYNIPYLLSTPTKSSAASTVDASIIETLNTPQKDVPEESSVSVRSIPGSQHPEGAVHQSMMLLSHTTPPKRRLAPKPPSLSKGLKVSPLLKKYRKMSPKQIPTKLRFILPKQRQIKIKRHVLKAKPPKEIAILPQTVCESEDVLATPLPEDIPKETSSQLSCDKNNIYDEEDDALGEEEELDDEEDIINSQQEEHLAALFKASSTIAEKQQHEKKTSGGQKLNKQQRRLQARIGALSCSENEQDNTSTALNFLKKAKEGLADNAAIFNDLICILQEFDSLGEMPEILYLKVADILKDFPLLADEFVMFLKPHQALRVGKYKEYCKGIRIKDFVQKLQHLSGTHELQLQKLVKLIQIMQDKTTSNEDVDNIKAKMAPILRYPHLLESFTQCFSSEPPTPCFPGDYEDMVLDSPGTPDSCEHINLVDDERPSSPDRPCACECHVSQSSTQSKPNRCTSCCVRFIDGRVYVQSGKTLRPAKVTYLVDKTKEIDENKNINVKTKTTRRPKTAPANKEQKT